MVCGPVSACRCAHARGNPSLALLVAVVVVVVRVVNLGLLPIRESDGRVDFDEWRAAVEKLFSLNKIRGKGPTDMDAAIAEALEEMSKDTWRGKCTIKWKGTNVVVDEDDIASMETMFDDLPEETSNDEAGGSNSKTDAEVLGEMIESVDKKADQMRTDITTCLAHLIALNASFDHIVGYIKKNASVDEDETSTVDPVTTSKKDGKKRARK